MSENPAIHIFSKPNCDFCARAKSVLQTQGLKYIEHDVEQSPAMAAASRYYSGSVNLPQIFIGSQHINGAEDLEALQSSGLIGSTLARADGELPLDSNLEERWIAGAEDFTLAGAMEQVDLTDMLDDQENLLILHFYKGIFGFSAMTYLYMAVWPEAYKACALSNVISTYIPLMEQVGPDGTTAVTFAASSAQGCTYCAVHTAARDGVGQTDKIKALHAARAGSPGPDNPYGALEVAMVELAEQATLNEVTDDQIRKITALAEAAAKDPQQVIEGTALAAQMMGLLNIFNDLTNVDIEGDMAALARKELGLEGGRHATLDSNPDNLNIELPPPEVTLETVLAARAERGKDWQGLAQQRLGHVPGWLSNWPEALRSVFAGMYVELMGESEISAELKQLMARTSAIAKGHEALAASAAVSAHHVAEDKDNAIERIRHCFAVATDQADSDLFSPEERLALRFAWLSAQTPIVTPARFVKPLTDHFSSRRIVELCIACGMACAVQRVAAAKQIQLGGEEAEFCRRNGIETDGLLSKYPLIAPLSNNCL